MKHAEVCMFNYNKSVYYIWSFSINNFNVYFTISRRGAKYSESLNIVISHPEFKEDTTESIDDFLEKFINDLKIQGFCTEYFPKGSSKYLVRIF